MLTLLENIFVCVFCVLYLSDATGGAVHAYPCVAPDATPVFFWLICLAKLTRNFILGILFAGGGVWFLCFVQNFFLLNHCRLQTLPAMSQMIRMQQLAIINIMLTYVLG
jgi:hypothetical protein